MKKRIAAALIGILLIAYSISVYAQTREFDSAKAFDWLVSQSATNYNNDVSSAGWAILAFNRGNRFSDAENALTWIETQKNPQNCFPAANCRTKDTSLALLSMNTLGKADTQPYVDWLKGSLLSSTATGSWLLEVTTDSTGSCKLSYESRNITQEVTIQVEKGKFPGCGNSNFYDLNNCMPNNPLRNNPVLELSADCSQLGGQSILSLIYKTGNTFYIISSSVSSSAVLKINNGCFGRARGDACNKESSLYATWALKALRSDIDTTIYLRSTYDKQSVEDNALLYFSAKDPSLAQQLKNLQQPEGSWERSVQKTALALVVLNDDPVAYEKEIGKAETWLATKQRADGSVNGNVLETALTLYAIGQPGGDVLQSGTCTDSTKNQDERGVDCGGVCESEDDCCSNSALDDTEEGVDCGGSCTRECQENELVCNNDGSCDRFAGESESNCPEDCKQLAKECVVNDKCEDDLGESAENCPDDCRCGDSICDDSESESSCLGDCASEEEEEEVVPVAKPSAKKSNVGTIIVIILVLAVLGAGGYFAFKRGLIKLPGAGKPTVGGRSEYKPFTGRPQLPPQRSQQPAQRSAAYARPSKGGAEDELEKSLEEAKKLLKK